MMDSRFISHEPWTFVIHICQQEVRDLYRRYPPPRLPGAALVRSINAFRFTCSDVLVRRRRRFVPRGSEQVTALAVTRELFPVVVAELESLQVARARGRAGKPIDVLQAESGDVVRAQREIPVVPCYRTEISLPPHQQGSERPAGRRGELPICYKRLRRKERVCPLVPPFRPIPRPGRTIKRAELSQVLNLTNLERLSRPVPLRQQEHNLLQDAGEYEFLEHDQPRGGESLEQKAAHLRRVRYRE